jgi:hypothetical protein
VYTILFCFQKYASRNHNYTLTLCSPSHHDSACSGLARDKFGISLAAQSMAAAAMHDGQYSRKLASVDNVERKSSLSI